MNIPNKLTMIRMFLIPVFMLLLLFDKIPHNYLFALIVFSVAALTDLLDGHIARRDTIVTDFGKFMDPLADKLLVTSALICFIELDLVSAVAVTIIIAREFAVTALRLVASGSGTVIAANIWGKAKTVSQMIAVIAIMFMQWINTLQLSFVALLPIALISDILIIIATTLTLISGVTYIIQNKKFISTVK